MISDFIKLKEKQKEKQNDAFEDIKFVSAITYNAYRLNSKNTNF